MDASSAGNTRGLIEAAPTTAWMLKCLVRLPRGIPAASLKQRRHAADRDHRRAGLPRGIPAASLKHAGREPVDDGCGAVFRGEYPRPH